MVPRLPPHVGALLLPPQLIAAVFPEDAGVSAEGVARLPPDPDDAPAAASAAGGPVACVLLPAQEVQIAGSLSEGLPGVAHPSWRKATTPPHLPVWWLQEPQAAPTHPRAPP